MELQGDGCMGNNQLVLQVDSSKLSAHWYSDTSRKDQGGHQDSDSASSYKKKLCFKFKKYKPTDSWYNLLCLIKKEWYSFFPHVV